MLVQVAFFVFALCGLLSLVIDVGFTRLTQVQLQTAADSAAMEGLRTRDITVRNAAGAAVIDPYASDCLRRAAANRMVRWTFDDDFNVANGDGEYQFGGGPNIELSEGVTSLHALQSISVPAARTYKPDVQFNQENVAYGDMVSGRFCYTDDPLPAEGAEYSTQQIVCTEPQRALGTYARTDFNPNDTSPRPPNAISECPGVDDDVPNPWPVGGTGSLRTADDSSFLVRLRRSSEFVDPEAGVASSGPPLPLLFGRAALVEGDAASGYSVRRDGFTVRATAIADAMPALQVGLPPTNGIGVTPFTLVDTYVAAMPATAAQITIDPTRGAVCAGLTCVAATPLIGRFIDALTDPTRARWSRVASVGSILTAATPLNCNAIGTRNGYVPVYSTMIGGTVRVIGFTRIALAQDPARANNTCAKTLTRSTSLVATTNASATVTDGLPYGVTATAAQIRELFDKNRVRTGRLNYQPVLAPALAR